MEKGRGSEGEERDVGGIPYGWLPTHPGDLRGGGTAEQPPDEVDDRRGYPGVIERKPGRSSSGKGVRTWIVDRGRRGPPPHAIFGPVRSKEEGTRFQRDWNGARVLPRRGSDRSGAFPPASPFPRRATTPPSSPPPLARPRRGSAVYGCPSPRRHRLRTTDRWLRIPSRAPPSRPVLSSAARVAFREVWVPIGHGASAFATSSCCACCALARAFGAAWRRVWWRNEPPPWRWWTG